MRWIAIPCHVRSWDALCARAQYIYIYIYIYAGTARVNAHVYLSAVPAWRKVSTEQCASSALRALEYASCVCR